MSEIFHFIGLCPDSLSHFDLMDLIALNYNQIQILSFYIRKCLGF